MPESIIEELEELGRILLLFTQSEDFTSPYFEQAEQHLKLYKKFKDTENWPYANRVHTPDTFAFVEDVVAKYAAPYLATDDFISCKSLPGDRVDLSRAAEANINYEMRHPRSSFVLEWIDYIRSGAIFGTSFFEVAPNIQYEPLTGTLTMSHVNFKTLDFWDVFPDFDCRRLTHDGRFFFKKEYVHIDTLRNLQESGFPYKNLDEAEEHSRTGDLPDYHRQIMQELGLEKSQYELDPDDGYMELLHYHADGQVKIIANRATFIFDTSDFDGQSPFLYEHPLIDWRYISQPNEFYGVGIPWVIRELQEDTNILLSQRRDNVDLAINPPLLLRRSAGIDINTLVYYPAAVWAVNDVNEDVQQMPPKDVTRTAYVEEDRNQTRMEDALGEHRYARGQSPERRETATGIMRLQQMSLARHDLGVKGLEYGGARAIGRRVLGYVRMYRTREHFARVAGVKPDSDVVNAFYDRSVEDLVYGMDFRTTGTNLSQIREQRVQNAQSRYKLLTGIPPEVAANNQPKFRIDYHALITDTLKEFETQNIDRIIVTDAPAERPQPGQMPVPQQEAPSIDEILQTMGAAE